VAANPQTKPVDLGCESAENWLLPSSTSTVSIVIITRRTSRLTCIMGRKMVAVVEVSLGTSGRRKIIMKPTLT